MIFTGCAVNSEVSKDILKPEIIEKYKTNKDITEKKIKISEKKMEDYEKFIRNTRQNFLKKENTNSNIEDEIFVFNNDNWEKIKLNEDIRKLIGLNTFNLNYNYSVDVNRDVSNIFIKEEINKFITNKNILWTKDFVWQTQIYPFLSYNKIKNYKLYKYIDNKYIYNKDITDNIYYIVYFEDNFLDEKINEYIKEYKSNNNLLIEKNEDIIANSFKEYKNNIIFSFFEDTMFYLMYLKEIKSLKYDILYDTNISFNKDLKILFNNKYGKINKKNKIEFYKNKIKFFSLYYREDLYKSILPIRKLIQLEFDEFIYTLKSNYKYNIFEFKKLEEMILENKVKNYNIYDNIEKYLILFANINTQLKQLEKNLNNFKFSILINDKISNKIIIKDLFIDKNNKEYEIFNKKVNIFFNKTNSLIIYFPENVKFIEIKAVNNNLDLITDDEKNELLKYNFNNFYLYDSDNLKIILFKDIL